MAMITESNELWNFTTLEESVLSLNQCWKTICLPHDAVAVNAAANTAAHGCMLIA